MSFKARIIGAVIGTLILLALMLFAPAGAKTEEKVVSRGKVGATIDMLREAKIQEGCKNPVVGAYSREKGRSDIVVVASCKDEEKNGKPDKQKKER